MFNGLFSRNGLSLDRLRNFLEVAEVGSIAKAAPDDVSRQSLISRQIRELEEFFGVELTVRRGKTLAISPAGERLSVLIREQFRDLLDFQREQKQVWKTFSIGAGDFGIGDSRRSLVDAQWHHYRGGRIQIRGETKKTTSHGIRLGG